MGLVMRRFLRVRGLVGYYRECRYDYGDQNDDSEEIFGGLYKASLIVRASRVREIMLIVF